MPSPCGQQQDVASFHPELAAALSKALQSGRPSCVEVHVSLDPIPPEERVIMGGSPF